MSAESVPSLTIVYPKGKAWAITPLNPKNRSLSRLSSPAQKTLGFSHVHACGRRGILLPLHDYVEYLLFETLSNSFVLPLKTIAESSSALTL